MKLSGSHEDWARALSELWVIIVISYGQVISVCLWTMTRLKSISAQKV